MVAGRELDALVAEKVMGWDEVDGKWGYPRGTGLQQVIPAYSTRIQDAWMLVEHFKGQQLPVRMDWLCAATNPPKSEPPALAISVVYGEWMWGVDLSLAQATAKELPNAICLAALKAVGAEVPE